METAWMVERPGFPPRYLTVPVASQAFEWTEDAGLGLRFAREIDALRMSTVFEFEQAFACEHQWS